jgi:S-formylglutathione hydrolase
MLELQGEHAAFGGVQRFYRHASTCIGLPMRCAVYLPPQAAHGPVPALFYLAGLTCTEETFPIKAGAQRDAARLGLALIAPDTSPRGTGIGGENTSWDFGIGAGFYVDATEAPWRKHFQMYSYIVDELRETVLAELPIDGTRLGIFGHSMGGHGALVLALRNPEIYRSVSAFAPIAAPSRCPWGHKAFSGYLGDDRRAWQRYDASELVGHLARPFQHSILIDQGLADQFLAEQLHPECFEAACQAAGQPLTLRRQPGYDHSYYFIASFMPDHLEHHARVLCALPAAGR